MNNLSQQFKNIGQQPSAEIKARICDNLMYQVYNHERLLTTKDKKNRFAMSISTIKFAWRPVGIFALVIMLFMGSSGLIMAAAQKATPGSKMFIVKRVIEKSQGLITTDSSQRAELASTLLGNRVSELQKVMVQESQLVSADAGSNKHSGKVILAIAEVKKQLAEVDNEVTQLKTNNNESNKKTAVTALVLNEKIENYKNELKQIKEKISDNEDIDNNLEQALNQVGDINSNILEVIVNKQRQGNLEIDDQEIGNKLADHVTDIEEKAKKIEKILSDNNDIKKENLGLSKRTDEAKQKIEDAKEAIKNNEFGLVLTLAKDSNKILDILYGDIYKVIENKEVVVDENDNEGNKEESEGEVKGVDVKVDTVDENLVITEPIEKVNPIESDNLEDSQIIIKDKEEPVEKPIEENKEFDVGIK